LTPLLKSGLWDGAVSTPDIQKLQLDSGKAGAGVSSTRVLVVEDFAPFRRFISSTLEERRDLQVICEVSDGLEAVQKAVELKPDLILMDIGLPTLSGIEAARRIRKLVPESKIIFLSQESSAEVVREALDLGAWGYVVKVKAVSGLMPAVEAALLGKKFVSDPMANEEFTP
jgi:DNA-binding NarL/FixJ family response regulator